jgi:CheY-like chemotaxis protein
VLSTGNRLLPFCVIDLGCVSGYLRVISPSEDPLARKILLADDSVTAQNMGRKILADAGYEVITVNNGSAALKKIAEQKPDLIVLDVYMPGYSGLEVCQRLKEAQETSRLPILLTVGKLEPFKPEEAKRVRADGFIVKPFEASELLSALSKLEDKIVPRAENSKPGRFARVTAAIEGRYDKTVAMEEDTGWKDRIAFPPKKKKAEPEESPADSVASHEQKKPAKWDGAKTEEPRVDLGALAPDGLPKDVTPEEIAALAAAAAQVKIAESGGLEPPPVPAWAEEKEQGSAGSPSQQLSHVAEVSAKVEEKKFEETATETVEAAQEQVSEAAAAARSNSDLIAAITGLESKADEFAGSSPANESSSREAVELASEPVTMAVAGADGARWTAVSVALGPEDAAISLEQEMQKAYAAFAAVENGFAAAVAASSIAESGTATATPPASESAVTESIPAIPAPEVAQSLSELANASTEAIQAAVQELKTVAESFVAEAAVPAEAAPTSSPQSDTLPEATQSVEAAAKEIPVTETRQEAVKEAEFTEPKLPEVKSEHEDRKEDKKETLEASQSVDPVATSVDAVAQETSGETLKDAAEAAAKEVSGEQVSASQSASSSPDSATVGTAVAKESGAEGKRESEETANTAAAWASWRRIRESGDSKEASMQESKEEAMAVAAGAEKSPSEADAESDPEAIASIVDSVLADLRPKIFEEISRKMGKKK